ncbi:hypothetical protein CAPTEDRAFT_206977 [Capitella teleta]|uniref:SGNH domain-containing protein n=1 Tax=Capitella teleta TaxID=283909 RepID=R7UZN0_CAPTE|nr:hypothetical protein CAPTEDRAFT_206977 [Capitella teleta]|eukprot:ELU08901.1 hypothetical protein CAPTEDRAFT_206977 [Capitella teleta]
MKNVRQLFLVLVTFASFLFLIHHQKSLRQDMASSLCTDADIKEFLKTNGQLPTGRWDTKTNLSASTMEGTWFKLDLECSMDSANMTSDRLRSCLLPKKRNHIMTIGDSNGKAYFNAISRIVRSSMSCELKREEHINKTTKHRDAAYFKKTDSDGVQYTFQVDRGRCWTCQSILYECTSGDRNLTLEHIGSHTLLLDGVNITIKRGNEKHIIRISFQDFIFRYYMKDNYPDVFFVFPPFNHVCRYSNPNTNRNRLSTFVDLLHQYLPTSTKVYWISAFREIEERRPKKLAFQMVNGEPATEGIKRLNQILLDILKSSWSDPESNDFATWDMMQASEGLESWSKDGVHMRPLWYKRMALGFLNLHCNSLR